MRRGNRRFAVGRLEQLEHRIVPGGKTTNDVLMNTICVSAIAPSRYAALGAVHEATALGTVADQAGVGRSLAGAGPDGKVDIDA